LSATRSQPSCSNWVNSSFMAAMVLNIGIGTGYAEFEILTLISDL
jgi:hypothetical protein